MAGIGVQDVAGVYYMGSKIWYRALSVALVNTSKIMPGAVPKMRLEVNPVLYFCR